jgi:hypothetical protein
MLDKSFGATLDEIELDADAPKSRSDCTGWMKALPM